jgi:hypothetical protein
MKRLLALIAVAGLAVALYAATATGGQQAVTPGQLNALKARVAKVEKRATNLESVIGACFTNAVPISRYAGYVYQNSDGSVIATTAIDVTNSGGTPGAYALDVGQQCANAINSTFGYRKLQMVRLPATAR